MQSALLLQILHKPAVLAEAAQVVAASPGQEMGSRVAQLGLLLAKLT